MMHQQLGMRLFPDGVYRKCNRKQNRKSLSCIKMGGILDVLSSSQNSKSESKGLQLAKMREKNAKNMFCMGSGLCQLVKHKNVLCTR